MSQKIACKTCGETILSDTAARNDGLCMPCRGGYRQRIEDGKKRREQERRQDESPERKYWVNLVRRVHQGPGFEALNAYEKTYFAVSCLIGEVYNGGFHQFFSNHSGEFYRYALDGLVELEAAHSVELTLRAKELLFGSNPVPVDWRSRNDALPNLDRLDAELDKVDMLFSQDPDKLHERCAHFARRHELY